MRHRGCPQEEARSSLYFINLPFSHFFEGKFVIWSSTRKDWLTNKGTFVSGSSCPSVPSVPSRGGRIKPRQCVERENHRKLQNSTETANNGIWLWYLEISLFNTHTHTHTRISWDLLMRPPHLGTKGADLQEMSDTNLPLLVNQSFLVQEQNYKLASQCWLKGNLKQYKLDLPSSYRHPNHASNPCTQILKFDSFISKYKHIYANTLHREGGASREGLAMISRLLKNTGLFCRI